MKFSRNVGGTDRILRFGFGSAMLFFGFVDNSFIADEVASIALGVIGAIILSTAIFGTCPLYDLIGFTSCMNHNDD